MKQPLISVIIPIYKIEKFLDKCIESVVKQTYKNLEIILVDDGSPDNCGSICDSWVERDNRISVIHKENGGAGMARNVGSANANGEFWAFIDGDDYLSEEMFECLIDKMTEDVDIVECEMLYTYDDNACMKWDRTSIEQTFSVEEALKSHIQDKYFKQTPCNKLYRRSVVQGIDFPIGKKIDDEFWTYQVIGKARKLIHVDVPLYAYRQHSNSVMHSMDSLKRLQAIDAKVKRHLFIIERFPSLKSESLNNLWFTCMYQRQLSMRHMNKLDNLQAKQIIGEVIKTYPIIWEDMKTLNIKQKIWLTLAKISFDATCKLRNKLKIGL